MTSQTAAAHPPAQQLLRASAKGELHRVISLINAGTTVAVNKHGRTALHIAAHRGFLDIVRVLLQAGCNPDIQDDNGDTALHRAVTAGHECIIQRLLDEACSVDCQNKLGESAVHEAARRGHNRILKLLIKAHGSPDCKNKNGDFPLHMSCANGHVTATAFLASLVSDVTQHNKQGDTPLHLAIRFGHVACSKVLIASKCNVDSQNQLGNSPLHIAVLTQNTKLTRILLNVSAKPVKLLNKERKSALDLAKELDNGELIVMLVSGPRPPSRRRGRKVERTSSVFRSSSEPRDVFVTKDSDKNINSKADWKGFAASLKKQTTHPQSPNICSDRKKRSSRKRPSVPQDDLNGYHKQLTANPYVVPQLYSLHRDHNGDIQQIPVLEQLPNPTPQIVDDLHQSIQQTRQEFEKRVAEANSSMLMTIQNMQERTEHQFRALDRVTSERIKAERTMCLHRIEQQAAYQRIEAEKSVIAKFEGLLVPDRSQYLSSASRDNASVCVCQESSPGLKRVALLDREVLLKEHERDASRLPDERLDVALPATVHKRLEARSVDSGVGIALCRGSTPVKPQSHHSLQRCDVAHCSLGRTRSRIDCQEYAGLASGSSGMCSQSITTVPARKPLRRYGKFTGKEVSDRTGSCPETASNQHVRLLYNGAYAFDGSRDSHLVERMTVEQPRKHCENGPRRSRGEASMSSLHSEDLAIIDRLKEVSLRRPAELW